MNITRTEDGLSHNFSSRVPAQTEALRAILTHENIPFQRAIGAGGECTIVERINMHRAITVIGQWQHAVSAIYLAVEEVRVA